MAKTQYLTYTIYLRDAEQVAAAQALYPSGILRGPEQAAIDYAAPIEAEGTPIVTPCIRSPWFQSTNNFPRNVTYFTRKSGGWFGIPLLFGTTTKYWWSGQFVYSPDPAPTVDESDDTTGLPPAACAQRRFVNGFEAPGNVSAVDGSGGTVSARTQFSRAASRLPGGYGLALRGDQGRYTMKVMAQQGGGASTFRESWERFYVRRHTDGAGFVWSAIDTGARGIFLQMLSGGGAIIHNGTSGTPNPIGTFSLAPVKHRWYKVDVFIRWGDFGGLEPQAKLRFYVDGQSVYTNDSIAGATGINAGAGLKHDQTDFGFGGTNEDNFSVDIDDHINADPSFGAYSAQVNYAVGNQVVFAGKFYQANTINGPGSVVQAPPGVRWTRVAPPADWANGSAIIPIRPNGLSASDTFTAGDWRVLLQRPVNPVGTAQSRTSAVSGAICQVTTDWADRIMQLPGSLGIVPAFLVSAYANRGSLVDGFVGYKINALAAVLSAAIVQTTSVAWMRLIYRPAQSSAPLAITALELLQKKGAEAISSRCDALIAQVEVIGNWGACDLPYGTSDTAPVAMEFRAVDHNSHIPYSQWTRNVAAPISPVMVKSGTYVGNGTGQDLTFKAAPTFVYIRPTTGDTGGVRWWPSLMAPHLSINEGSSAFLLPDVRENTAFPDALAEDAQEQAFILRLAGNSAQSNALGVTYEYVIVCDPGMRFLCAGGGAQDTGVGSTPTDAVVQLNDPTFTPDAALAVVENAGGASTANGMYFRGAGHTGNQSAVANLAVTANGMTLGLGVVNAFGTGVLNADGLYLSVLAIRANDGSTDAGKSRVVQVATWTGNGGASRDILIPGVTGRRPLFMMIFPNDNGGMHYRDPSHTGVNASRYDGVNITNAITAGGLDQFTVGAACNVNTVVYHAFIVVGDTVAGNAGWSADAELFPVEPDSAAAGPWAAPPDFADQGFDENGNVVTAPVTGAAEQPDLDNTTDLPDTAFVCADFTTIVCNMALGHIGVTKKIVNINTDTTQQARAAREHIKQCVEEVLREFDWPFATEYAALVFVAGTETAPVNEDWTYSHRAPSNLIKARRLVNVLDGTKRAYDADPPTFKMGRDSLGKLVFSETLEPTLEYTKRDTCPAYFGDALFKLALSWRLAAAFAPELAKDTKKQALAWEMYRDCITRAEVPAANESQPEVDGDAPWTSAR